MTSQVPDLGMALKCFAEQLGGLRDAFQAQGISQVVPNFDGKQAEFHNWIKAIEKYSLLARLPDDKKRFIALQSSSGLVADFLQRYLNSHPGCKWDMLKQELIARFALVSDSMHALTLLGRKRQGRNENIQIFAERLLNLAQQAFQDQGVNGEDPIHSILQLQHQAFTHVHRNLQKARKRQKRYADKNAQRVEFKVGSPVYYKNFRRTSKFAPNFLPYNRIIEQKGPVTFIIKSQLDGTTTKATADQLRLANLDWGELRKEIFTTRQVGHLEKHN